MEAVYSFKSYTKETFEEIKASPPLINSAVFTQKLQVDQLFQIIDQLLEMYCAEVTMPFYSILEELQFLPVSETAPEPATTADLKNHQLALMYLSPEKVKLIKELLEKAANQNWLDQLQENTLKSVDLVVYQSGSSFVEQKAALQVAFNALHAFFVNAADQSAYVSLVPV